jgi:hypothetical protein
MGQVIKMSDEEKQKILEKHKQATEKINQHKEELKKGLQKPEKKDNKKTS